MIFYALPVSTYSAKVRIVLLAKNVRFEERAPPDGYRSAAYRAIVPMGTLPAIDDNGFILSESEAINEYLEDRFPHPALLPSSPQDRAAARFLSRFHDLYLEPPVRALFAHMSPAKRDVAVVAARAAEIDRRVTQLAQLAKPRPYLAGASLTLADCGFAVTLPLAQRLLGVLGQPFALPPNLTAWQASVAAHPAVETALAPWRTATEAWVAAQVKQ
ncbi:MAG: glutathione S-transferase family protein [Burkholderiales bacterium]